MGFRRFPRSRLSAPFTLSHSQSHRVGAAVSESLCGARGYAILSTASQAEGRRFEPGLALRFPALFQRLPGTPICPRSAPIRLDSYHDPEPDGTEFWLVLGLLGAGGKYLTRCSHVLFLASETMAGTQIAPIPLTAPLAR